MGESPFKNSVCQEDTTSLNLCVLNNMHFKRYKAKKKKDGTTRRNKVPTIIAGESNVFLSVIARTSRPKQ